jgi:hypothetical protein
VVAAVVARPRSQRSGRVGGRVWLVVILLIVGFVAAQELVSIVAAPENFAARSSCSAGFSFRA